MKIYPITDISLSGLSHAAQVERLIAGGAETIQLREKRGSAKDFFADAARALEIARKNGVKIIINDRVDIALALRADGVHLGQDDLPPVEARKILGAHAIIGFSTHNLNQAVEAVENFPVDYIAVGPVFPTRTKENPDAVVGLETIKTVRARIGNFPLVAIGGINFQNFRSVLDAGANSAAVISDLLSKPDEISERIKKFLNLAETRTK